MPCALSQQCEDFFHMGCSCKHDQRIKTKGSHREGKRRVEVRAETEKGDSLKESEGSVFVAIVSTALLSP